ncbi:hypothetical protein [Glaesserella sp.]|uniref:hypothetical protein n=1 Tax=Glaesserella sp. TaxID=2094731 RepID=UPI0035A0D78F
MLINNKTIHDVHDLEVKEKREAKIFIRGAVYCWLNTHGEDVFAVRDLFGKDNTDWTGTPLECVWNKNKRAGKNNDEAFEQSAKDVGWLLKAVLEEDRLEFKVTKSGLTNGYSWIRK